MNKWKARYLQTFGALLQAGAALLFVIAGDENAAGLLFPSAAVGIAGLLLWGKGARELNPAPEDPPALNRSPPRLEEMLLSLQEDVARLREDREFYKELYSPEGEGRKSISQGRP